MRPPDVALLPNHHSYQTGVWLGVWSSHMLSLTSELAARHHALTTVTVVVFGSVSLFAALRFLFPLGKEQNVRRHIHHCFS